MCDAVPKTDAKKGNGERKKKEFKIEWIYSRALNYFLHRCKWAEMSRCVWPSGIHRIDFPNRSWPDAILMSFRLILVATKSALDSNPYGKVIARKMSFFLLFLFFIFFFFSFSNMCEWRRMITLTWPIRRYQVNAIRSVNLATNDKRSASFVLDNIQQMLYRFLHVSLNRQVWWLFVVNYCTCIRQ